MSALDATLNARIGWMRGLDLHTMMTDPDLATRVLQSYVGDSTYVGPDVAFVERLIDGPLGPASLRIRIYDSACNAAGPRPALLWMHGGGFISGGLDDIESDLVAREISARSGNVVIAVDYHLADGRVGYPTLHREVACAFRWSHEHADELGIDAGRLLLGGASAGGNLALAAALQLRDAAEPAPSGLVLVYPLLHQELPPWRDGPPDFDEVPASFRFPAAMFNLMYDTYLATSSSGGARYASVEGHLLNDLPPTLVMVAEFDDLRASGEFFADSARLAGVDVSEYLARGVVHGHLAMPADIPETDRSLQVIADYLGRGPEHRPRQ
ncbi:alpha/beta hydrolase [Microbacterium sp. NPDC079995]|uniref:alpha/beta hydrolase n=1 Tax=unclassified Microbacterium TaxID=2609290 RepID=UPI00344F79E3